MPKQCQRAIHAITLCSIVVGLGWTICTYAADTKPLASAPSEDLLLWLIEMDIQTKDDTEAINAAMSQTKDSGKSMQTTTPVNQHPSLISRKNGVSHE